MTFFLNYDVDKPFLEQEGSVSRAIYFNKPGLSQQINPIRLVEDNNKKYMMQLFAYYSNIAKENYPAKMNEWII